MGSRVQSGLGESVQRPRKKQASMFSTASLSGSESHLSVHPVPGTEQMKPARLVLKELQLQESAWRIHTASVRQSQDSANCGTASLVMIGLATFCYLLGNLPPLTQQRKSNRRQSQIALSGDEKDLTMDQFHTDMVPGFRVLASVV